MLARTRSYALSIAAACALLACSSGAPGSLGRLDGTVHGLTESGLVLQLNGSKHLPVAAGATSFSFGNIAEGTRYEVRVLSQPGTLVCTVGHGQGTTGSSNQRIVVVCAHGSCGDMVVSRPEECDSFDSFACGGCGDPGSGVDCLLGAPTPATGSILVESTALAGVTVTVDDGLGVSETFEFVSGTAAQRGHRAVDITGADAIVITERLVEAWRATGLHIDAAAMTDRTRLIHQQYGVVGNRPLVVRPQGTTALSVSGMSRGAGCEDGQRCSHDDDCVSRICGTNGLCATE
jgi:hypothetical protein